MDISELECPICKEVFKKPILLCATGHSICNDCRKNCTECPTCKGSFLSTRNYSLESLLEKSPLKCENEACQLTILGTDNYINHLWECEYQVIKCGVPNCVWSDILLYMNSHFEHSHLDMIVDDGVLFNGDLNFCIMKFDELHFYVNLFETENEMIFWSVRQATPSFENKITFKCIINLSNSVRNMRIEQPCYFYCGQLTLQDLNVHDNILVSRRILQDYEVTLHIEPY